MLDVHLIHNRQVYSLKTYTVCKIEQYKTRSNSVHTAHLVPDKDSLQELIVNLTLNLTPTKLFRLN